MIKRKTVWKEVPELGDKVRPYVTQPLVIILGVRPYDGRYTQWFTHFIRFWSPITHSEIEGCWPMAGDCTVYLDELESE